MKKLDRFAKRSAALMLSLLLVVGMLPATVFAAAEDKTELTGDVNITVVPFSEDDESTGDNTATAPADADLDPVEGPELDVLPEGEGEGDGDAAEGEEPADGKTERPEGSKDVTASAGADKSEDSNWDIFYDAERDVYNITFNIGAGATDTIQTIDLTKALELLNQYAQKTQDEFEVELAKLKEKLTEPKRDDYKLDPDVVKPVEPGKPEGLDENVEQAYKNILAEVPRDDEGEPAEDYDYAQAIANATGLDASDEYVKEMASYMYDQAMVDWAMDNWETWKDEGHIYAEIFGDIDTFLFMGCGIEVTWPDGTNKGTPVLKVPEYEVNKEAPGYEDAYKAYEKALEEYNGKVAVLEKQYADDKAAYDAAIEELEKEYNGRYAATMQPGDVRKFQLFITSDSKHTYKYIDGSFTLATPGWTGEGDYAGFDGQFLPNRYIDKAEDTTYSITLFSEPIQALLWSLKESDPDYYNSESYDGSGKIITNYAMWWDNDVVKVLAEYKGDTVEDQLFNYILDYYGKKYDTEYGSIQDLIANNPDAAMELVNLKTPGNRPFSIRTSDVKQDEFKFTVEGLETIRYDYFYQYLFGFAFGSEEDIKDFLVDGRYVEAANSWAYDNYTWADYDYKDKDDENASYLEKYRKALSYYMDHQEIWEETNKLFNSLLSAGMTADTAVWPSLMMAINIDAEAGNAYELTQWGWYSSIQLKQVDYDFTLIKKDGETGKTITESETGFQVYYIDKVKDDETGEMKDVKMYCTAVTDDKGNLIKDEEGKVTYVFKATESTIFTENGKLNIDYALLKDVVYYLQEMIAPKGYERDANVYILMSEDDYNSLTDEDKAALEGNFDKFLNVETNGMTVSVNFVNKPSDPPDPNNPPPPPPPEEDIPEIDIPLDEPPDPPPPDEDIPEEPIPLGDIPETGDISNLWYGAALVLAAGLAVLLDQERRSKKST